MHAGTVIHTSMQFVYVLATWCLQALCFSADDNHHIDCYTPNSAYRMTSYSVGQLCVNRVYGVYKKDERVQAVGGMAYAYCPATI
jgi:hypothetical protein